ASSSKEHLVVKKPAEEHPAVKKPTEVFGEEHPTPTVKKPTAVGEEHPSPTVKKPTTVGEEHPAVKQLVKATGKKLTEEILLE
ncbi:hypothetical protein BHE74_00023676, partial [Ensete ventricosum]